MCSNLRRFGVSTHLTSRQRCQAHVGRAKYTQTHRIVGRRIVFNLNTHRSKTYLITQPENGRIRRVNKVSRKSTFTRPRWNSECPQSVTHTRLDNRSSPAQRSGSSFRGFERHKLVLIYSGKRTQIDSALERCTITTNNRATRQHANLE